MLGLKMHYHILGTKRIMVNGLLISVLLPAGALGS